MKNTLAALLILLSTWPLTAQEIITARRRAASGAIATFVQGVSASAAAVAVTAGAITVTAGHLIVAAPRTQASATGSTLVMSSTGVTCTWTQPTGSPNWVTTFSSALAYCVPASSGSMTITSTWTVPAGGGFSDIGIAEYAPGGGKTFTGTLLDQVAVIGSSVSVTSCTSGTTSATTNATDLVIGVCFNFNSPQTYGAAAGFTFRSTASSNDRGMYDLITGTTGTQTFTTTVTSDFSTGWVLALKLT